MRLAVAALLASFAVPVVLPRVAGAADDRADEPAAKAVSEARKLIKDLFKNEYARTAAKDQAALALKLLKQAEQSQGDPPARFALLEEARNLAAKAGDATTAMKAADQLAASFKVSRGKVWAEIASPLVGSARSPQASRDVAILLLSASGHASDEDEWAAAVSLSKFAEIAARKARDFELLKNARVRARHIAKLKAEADKVRDEFALLKTKPDDPAANLAVGRFLCLYKLDWDAGVQKLAKGTDQKLKAAAQVDLQAAAGDGGAKLAAADQWYDLARTATKDHKPAIQLRAHHWYLQALPMLTSLQKVKAEKRIAELQPAVAALGGSRSLWTEIRKLIAANKLRKWQIIGGGFSRETFEEIPQGGAILIGFKYTTISRGRYPGVVQAIYRTSGGEAYGRVYGTPERGAKLEVVKAKPGYAVGAITTRGGGGFDAFKPIFLRIKANGLDVNDKYDGPHIGGKGGSEATLGGDGQFIIGLHGKLGRNAAMQAMSPVSLLADKPTKSTLQAMLRGQLAYNDFQEPYRTELVNSWKKEVERVEARLRSYKRPRTGGKVDRRSLRVRRIRMGAVERDLKKLQENDPPYIPTFSASDSEKLTVGRIADGSRFFAYVIQIIDKETMLIGVGRKDKHWAILKGISSNNRIDGSKFKPGGFLLISGTTTYKTVIGGTKTVPLIIPVTLESLKNKR